MNKTQSEQNKGNHQPEHNQPERGQHVRPFLFFRQIEEQKQRQVTENEKQARHHGNAEVSGRVKGIHRGKNEQNDCHGKKQWQNHYP